MGNKGLLQDLWVDLGSLLPALWIYRIFANPGDEKREGRGDRPSPVLAPESALGSRPRVALSSAQVRIKVRRIPVWYQGKS